jgi:excisionase family DNA binding protein
MTAVCPAPLTLDSLRDRVFLTTAEAAELYQLDMDTVLKCLRTGEIPGFKVGRQWRIPAAKVLALLSGDAA